MTPRIEEKGGRFRLINTDTGNPLSKWHNTRYSCYLEYQKNKPKQEGKK